VVASSNYARSGFLINVQDKTVTAVPDLILPWGSFRPGRHSPAGKSVWVLEADGLALVDTTSGKLLKQFFFRRLFTEQPKPRKAPQRGLQARVRRHLVLGCTGGKVAVLLGGQHLFVIDRATGKWRACEDLPPGMRSGLVRPGTNELWAFGEGLMKVYELAAK